MLKTFSPWNKNVKTKSNQNNGGTVIAKKQTKHKQMIDAINKRFEQIPKNMKDQNEKKGVTLSSWCEEIKFHCGRR